MAEKKVEFRYYEMPGKEWVLALLGMEWIRPYGEGIDWLHFHNFMEIGICHYGTGEIILDKKHFCFQENAMVIIPPRFPHTTNCRPGTKAFWEWMYFDIEAALEHLYPDGDQSIFELKYKIYERPFFFWGEAQPTMERILKLIMEEMRQKRNLYQESVKGLLQAFLIEVLRMGEELGQIDSKSNEMMGIAPAINYAEENYKENMKISHMALACNMSESYFRKVFHQNMGMAPLDYLNLIRIQKACNLMKSTRFSMEAIACQIGFENVSTFNRNFKKLVGVTPYHWKKSEANYEGKLLNYKINAEKGWR